jgi:hypothetical protein
MFFGSWRIHGKICTRRAFKKDAPLSAVGETGEPPILGVSWQAGIMLRHRGVACRSAPDRLIRHVSSIWLVRYVGDPQRSPSTDGSAQMALPQERADEPGRTHSGLRGWGPERDERN